MPQSESTITLCIRETSDAAQRQLIFNVLVDGELIAANQSLAPGQSAAVRELSRRYNELFEGRYLPDIADAQLKSIGAELFDLWLASAWPSISARIRPGAARLLVIASKSPEVLNLPWELIRIEGGDHLGFDPKFSLRRLPRAENSLPEFDGQLPGGPLRVLFVACAPLDEVPLDYEKEEESLIRVMAKAGPNVVFDSGDMGSFDELQERINLFDPHVVYLTGHGIVEEDGLGYFCLEDERGESDPRSSKELRKLFGGSSVQCVFVSGCQTGKAPPVSAIGGICQGLVSEEVPLAIGWAASIADTVATEFATQFFKTLAAGQPIGRAMAQARQAIRQMCDEMGYPAWTLPVLYAATTQAQLFDPQRYEKPRRPNLKMNPLPGMTEGYAEHFVGRRREIQRLLPALRDGSLQTTLLTGIGGAGKSTLATRLARKLETDGFAPIAISSTAHNPLNAAQLLQVCGDAFLKAGLREAFDTLNNPQIPVDARLRYIVSALNDHRFALVLDNFEVNLDETTRRVINEEIAAFYRHLLSNLVGDSRALVTCRYLPADAPLPRTAREEALGDFPEAQFIKLLLREPELERRYYAGELPRALLVELHALLGGTPRFLLQIRQSLKTMTADELRRELEQVKLPPETEAGKLQGLRDDYCQTIFTARLYGYLSAEAQRALSRAAVYGVPVNLAGLAAASGESEDRLRDFTRQWQDYALAYPEREKAAGELWTVYGLLRGWLLERLSTDERREAHLAAGDFLHETVKQERADELGMYWVACLSEARTQYLMVGDFARAREMTERICVYLMWQGFYREIINLNHEMLDYEEHPRPMVWIGRAYLDLAEYFAARDWYQRGLAAAGEAAPKEAAETLHGLATIDLRMGDYAVAREKLQRSLEIRQQIGDHTGEASNWHQLATIDVHMGDYAAAREKCLRSLEIRQQIDDCADEAHSWSQLATIDGHLGDYVAAQEKFLHSLEITQRIGNRSLEAAIWHQLASIALNLGDYAAAREKFQRSLEIKQQIGDRAGEASTWHQFASIDLNLGDYAAAREKLQRSLEITQQIGNRSLEAGIWHQLASIDLNLGDYAAARKRLQRSLEINQQIGDRAGEASTWHQLASIDFKAGDYAAAREMYLRSLQIKQQIGDRAGEAFTFYQLGFIGWKIGRQSKSARLVALSFVIAQSLGVGQVQHISHNLAEMTGQLGYTQEQVAEMLNEVAESYQRDRGAALLRAAFGEE